MKINTQCPHCGQKYETEDTYINTEATCQQCEKTFVIKQAINDILTIKKNHFAIKMNILFDSYFATNAVRNVMTSQFKNSRNVTLDFPDKQFKINNLVWGETRSSWINGFSEISIAFEWDGDLMASIYIENFIKLFNVPIRGVSIRQTMNNDKNKSILYELYDGHIMTIHDAHWHEIHDINIRFFTEVSP